jgi:hypothetical protein
MPQVIIQVGIAVAMSVLSRALAPKPDKLTADDGPKPVNAPEVRYTQKQSLPPKRIIYGRAEVGGALCFEEVKPPYLYRMFMLCDEPIAGVVSVRIAKNRMPLELMTHNTIRTPVGISGQADYPNRLRLCFRDGRPDQAADALIAAGFANLGADFRQRGIATISARMHYGADWDERQKLWGGNQAPDLMFVVDGIGVPDPRNPSNTIFYDPSDLDEANAARATWTRGVNNAALVQAHYLTQPYGGRIPPDKIDWDKVMRAAERDDELMGTKEGVLIRKHTIDTVINMNQSPNEVIDSMRAGNRGFVLNSGSRVWVTSSMPQEPIATIHDGLLAGGIQYRDAQPKRDLANRVKARCIIDERNYVMDDLPILDRTDLRADDGEPLDATLDLPVTRDHRRGQRLQKIFLDEKRRGKTLSVPVDVAYLAECKGKVAGFPHRFDSAIFPKCNGVWFCRKATFVQGFAAINLDMIEYDKDIEDDWHPTDDERDFDLADLDLS